MSADSSQARSRPAKSAAAYRTISEVSEDLQVPQHVLRFWETKFSQVRPLKRGGGRRYYRPEDVALLRHIQHLLYNDGYTIKGVQRLLKESRGQVVFDQAGDDEEEAQTEADLFAEPLAAATRGGTDAHASTDEDDDLEDEVDAAGTDDGLDLQTRKQLEELLLELKALRKFLRSES